MRFKLKSPHYINDRTLDTDTEIEPAVVKDGKVVKAGKIIFAHPVIAERNGVRTMATEAETDWPGPPSAEMDGVDTEGKAAVERRMKTFMSTSSSLPIHADREILGAGGGAR